MNELKTFGRVKFENLSKKMLLKMSKETLVEEMKRLQSCLDLEENKYEELKKEFDDAKVYVEQALKQFEINPQKVNNLFSAVLQKCKVVLSERDNWMEQYGSANVEFKHYKKGNFILYNNHVTKKRETWEIPKDFSYGKVCYEMPIEYAGIRLFYDKEDKKKYTDVTESLYEYIQKNEIAYYEEEEEILDEDIVKLLEKAGYEGKISDERKSIWNVLLTGDKLTKREIQEQSGVKHHITVKNFLEILKEFGFAIDIRKFWMVKLPSRIKKD